MEGGEKVGALTAMTLISLGLLPKAALEAAYFQDRESAKKTLRIWLMSTVGIAVGFGFTFLFDHLG